MHACIKTRALLIALRLSAHAFPRESGFSLSDEIYRLEIYSRILSLEQLMRSRAFTIKIKLSFHDREGDHFVQIAVKAARNIYFYIFCHITTIMCVCVCVCEIHVGEVLLQ